MFLKKDVSVPKNMMATADVFLWQDFIKKVVYITLI